MNIKFNVNLKKKLDTRIRLLNFVLDFTDILSKILFSMK